MGAKKSWFYKLSLAAVVLGLVAISSILINGQTASAPRGGVPDDWTHHHVVFTDPGTAAQALAQGRLAQWYRIVNEPRYQIQQLKRSLMRRQTASAPDFAARMALLKPPTVDPGPAAASAGNKKVTVKKDWSMDLGLSGGVEASQTGTVSGAATGGQTITITNGSNSIILTATPTAASATGTFSGEPASGGTVMITNGTAILVLTVSTTTTTTSCTLSGSTRSGRFRRNGTTATNASNFLTAINGTNCGSYVGLATATRSGDVVTITASTAGSAGNSITLADSMTNFAWSSSTLVGGVNSETTGTYFATSSTAATEAANIVSAIKTNGSTVGVSASTTGGGNVTVTATSPGAAGNSITLAETLSNFSWNGTTLTGGAGTPGTMAAGQYPAKYSFSTTSASCGDYVVYGTGLAGSSSQATVVAYTNLYASTCGSTTPTIAWAYNTGGAAALSPVLSLDGTQVAYIQTAASTASLVLLKPSASSGGTVSSPGSIGSAVANSAYRACTAPCYTTLTLSGSRNDTNSPPFYDYVNDIAWVGDDGGYVHKFTGVFAGTPAEATAGGWPVQASAETSPALNGPIYDSGASQLIFVGDATGYLHSVTTTGSSSQTVLTANQNVCGTAGMVDSPLVDPSTEQVYVFVGDGCDATPGDSYVNRFAAGTSIGSSYGQNYVNLGNASTNSASSIMRDGDFDNTYYAGAGTTGNLYVCENGTLFQIPMSELSGTGTVTPSTFSTPVSSVSSSSTCSPVTEFSSDSTHDYIFLGVAANGNAAGCTGACLYNYNVYGAGSTGNPISGLASAGGTSGIVIDNNGSATGESQIYFSNLGAQTCTGTSVTGSGTGGCAVQASQTAP